MNLLIVESPAKAKTIEKYLGSPWHVIASVGHVRDLVPEDGSVDTDKDFAMKWQIMPGKEKQIKLILEQVKKADAVYLASDPDREGEAIAWHILDILKSRGALKKKPVYRVVFHEITKKVVNEAIANPREIDQNLVDAYLVRRALDYLIGFKLSPVLWRKNIGKSAGRVQSVAVALVIDREAEIEAFKSVEYWSLDAKCEKEKSKSFIAHLTEFAGDKIEKMTIENSARIEKITAAFSVPGTGIVSNLEKKKSSRKPAAPFTTSTLQQEASRKLRFSSKRTMAAAQKLYEAGLITYMRTDATNLSAEAVDAMREYIKKSYGSEFLPSKPNVYITKSKNAQEAHEAIRPTDATLTSSNIHGDEDKLYELIWKRTISCQMANAEFDSVVVDVDVNTKSGNATFHAVGTTRTFDGFLKVYVEGKDDSDDDDNESKLPSLALGDKINIVQLLPEQHFTTPPPRYTEATLVKKLEELGIGRPSTYAGIMSTIVDREYVKLDKQRFFPTDGGWLVAKFLGRYFGNVINVDFTAKTEDTLDEVSRGENNRSNALSLFWKHFLPAVTAAKDVPIPEIMAELTKSMHAHLFPDGKAKCPECGADMELKVSKYGAFLGCSRYPECKYTKRLSTTESADNNTDNEKVSAPVSKEGIELGDGITFKVGRFGPYVTDGKKNASAKKYSVDTITLENAKELLDGAGKKAEGLELGINTKTGKPILYFATGRYGAYISSNKVNVSVKEEPDLETAADLINNKKPSAKKTWGKKK